MFYAHTLSFLGDFYFAKFFLWKKQLKLEAWLDKKKFYDFSKLLVNFSKKEPGYLDSCA